MVHNARGVITTPTLRYAAAAAAKHPSTPGQEASRENLLTLLLISTHETSTWTNHDRANFGIHHQICLGRQQAYRLVAADGLEP
ncbi:hypothetical protein THAOC_22436, partial [Thalassiosira oceanica]